MNKMTKNELRQKYRIIRNTFGEEFVKEASRLACQNIEKSEAFLNADTVLLYYPIKNEISPLPLFELCLRMGKEVAFPVCQNEVLSLEFRKISSLDELSNAIFGISEPNSSCEIASLTKNTLCLVPAIAFSKSGHRLGYGKGFYDRFLTNFEGISAGFSYSTLVLDSLPHEVHDIPLAMIVTESEVMYFAEKN